MEIKVELTKTPQEKPDVNNLSFGKYYTDHMFVMDYDDKQGWHDARIVPYGPFLMDPACMVLHYGQTTFEGLKAYKGKDGRIRLFRPEKNMIRLNRSNERVCMPQFDGPFVVEAIKKLVKIDEDWIPSAPGTSDLLL